MYNLSLLLLQLLLTLLFSKSIGNEYCNLHYHHILCSLPSVSNSCHQFREVAPDGRQQWEIVDWHNRIRQQVAQGLERRGYGGPLHPASNMMKMEWDPELARIAQGYVNQCRFGHSCKKCRRVIGGRFAVGENLAVIRHYTRNNNPIPFDFLDLMNGWYESEVSYVRSSLADNYFHDVNWGHYTQMIWWNTRSIGCGGSVYTRGGAVHQLVACQYGAAANLRQAKIYEKGPPCSNCPLDTACDSYYYGLCAIIKHPFNVEDSFPNTDQVYLGRPPGTFVQT